MDRVLVVAQVAESWTRDLRVATLAPALPARRDMAVIAVEERTLARLTYRSPVDRAFLAELVEALAERGARAIGIGSSRATRTAPRGWPTPAAGTRRRWWWISSQGAEGGVSDSWSMPTTVATN